jgi:hypothetical protein
VSNPQQQLQAAAAAWEEAIAAGSMQLRLALPLSEFPCKRPTCAASLLF